MELQIIQSKIYEIRGIRVLLDFDLAEMYQVETKNLKRAVRRNIERFPEDFMFELTESENEDLRCNFGTSSWGGSRYPPFAFSEQGSLNSRAYSTVLWLFKSISLLSELS